MLIVKGIKISLAQHPKAFKNMASRNAETRDAGEMLRCLLWVGFFGSFNEMGWCLWAGASEEPTYAKNPIKQDQKS